MITVHAIQTSHSPWQVANHHGSLHSTALQLAAQQATSHAAVGLGAVWTQKAAEPNSTVAHDSSDRECLNWRVRLVSRLTASSMCDSDNSFFAADGSSNSKTILQSDCLFAAVMQPTAHKMLRSTDVCSTLWESHMTVLPHESQIEDADRRKQPCSASLTCLPRWLMPLRNARRD